MAQAWGQNSTSLGYTALAAGDFSVAIGHQSRAPLAWSVSFGNASIKRQLVNVAAGIDTNDVVIVGQLNQALERLEKKIAQLEAQIAAR
jgi:autotransporter adhesin